MTTDAPANPTRRRNILIGAGVLLFGCCGLFAVSTMGGDDATSPEPAAEAPAADAPAEETAPVEEPTVEPEPTDEPEAPTDEPPTEVPAEPIRIEGSGQTATDSIEIPFPIAVAAFTHNGTSNFAVKAIAGGDEELLINEIGAYSGQVLLPSADSLLFDIDADGAWTLDISPVGMAESASFSGTGDAVSGLFDPPDAGPWEFSHDGESNFAVVAVCSGGTDLVQNEIGVVSGSGVVSFEDGPCLWKVTADGNWSLAPRQ